jgi:hypothetical protein
MKKISASSYMGTRIYTVNSCPSTKWRSIVFFADSVDTGKQADGSRIRDKKAEWPDSTQQEKNLWLYGAVYTVQHGVMQCTWRFTKKTARKRNWGDRNWLCKVKFQFRVHFRQKGEGGAPRETSSGARVKLADGARTLVRTVLCTPALYPHFSTYLWLCCIIEGERREGQQCFQETVPPTKPVLNWF